MRTTGGTSACSEMGRAVRRVPNEALPGRPFSRRSSPHGRRVLRPEDSHWHLPCVHTLRTGGPGVRGLPLGSPLRTPESEIASQCAGRESPRRVSFPRECCAFLRSQRFNLQLRRGGPGIPLRRSTSTAAMAGPGLVDPRDRHLWFPGLAATPVSGTSRRSRPGPTPQPSSWGMAPPRSGKKPNLRSEAIRVLAETGETLKGE